MIFDYKPEIKQVLSGMYKPADVDNDNFEFLSLQELIVNLGRVIPSTHVSETDTYEVLKELGFEISQDHENNFGFMVESVV